MAVVEQLIPQHHKQMLEEQEVEVKLMEMEVQVQQILVEEQVAEEVQELLELEDQE